MTLNGDSTPSTRTKQLADFKESDSIDVLIMSKVGTVGLNMTWVRYMVVYVRPYP